MYPARLDAARRKGVVLAVTGALCAAAPAQAANWLKLQGTEGGAERARLWGFIQPQYQYSEDSKLPAGPWAGQSASFNLIRPDLDSGSQFQLRRARLGVRGVPFPKDPNINYFFLVEAGNNGITGEGGGSLELTDASVTLNHLKQFTRVRIGQFKHPGSEDGQQAIHVHNYVDFATPTDQLLQERFFDNDGSVPGDPNKLNGPVGAFRDIGIQFFNFFRQDSGPFGYPWEHSYAFMVGNGNGITRGDDNDDKDIYLYASTGPIFAGKGGRRQDAKLFAWYQDGERTLTVNGGADTRNFDRTRWGVGLTFRKSKYRFVAEYFDADGVIFNGTDGGAVPGAVSNDGTAVASFNVLPDNEAHGWYVDVGYQVLPKLELDYRFSRLDRGTEGADTLEREFWDHTIGAQWFFNKKVRAIVNYQFRDAEAPGFADSAPPNQIVGERDDLFSAQVLAVF